MNNLFTKSIVNDKYYIKFKYLFNYTFLKFNLINLNILFNFIHRDDNKICNFDLNKHNYNQYYSNIIYKFNKFINFKNSKFNTNYDSYIINKFNNNKCILIVNSYLLLKNYSNINKILNYDIIEYYNFNYLRQNKLIKNFKNPYVNYNLFKKFYSSILMLDIYKQFLKNLKNNNEENKISIPKQKYSLVVCNYSYIETLSFTASYKMMLEIPNIISTISMSLKIIEKEGTLLLFWSIVNVNIPVIKKILAILAYGFKTVEIIDNDINQNLLIGVPEYYIKCSGYKDNISNDIINKLIDIAIETIDYIYKPCDVLDYYEDYTEKNPNHSLFYNKPDDNYSRYSNRNTSKTIKSSRLSSSSSSRKSSKSTKPITPIYYIEDINIPELDEIMKDSNLQFKVSLLMNKLEGIFVGYFEMVNNLIENSIARDRKGNMYVKPEAILKKDITNLTRLINMFEVNKLPYNKHALKVLLGKQDELIKNFYSLDIPVNIKLIKYDDRITKHLNKSALTNFKKTISRTSSRSRSISITTKNIEKNNKKLEDYDIINHYYNKVKLSQQTRFKILEDIDFTKYFNHAPKSIEYAAYDFAPGLCEYINNKYIDTKMDTKMHTNTYIDIQFVKLWEILKEFNLIPNTVKFFKILHLSESSGQSIMCAKYWAETKCINLNMNNYEWLANCINPYFRKSRNYINNNNNNNANDTNNTNTNNYINNLINNNYENWLWGADNTGEITNINNIKSMMNNIKLKWESRNGKTISNNVDLIICDDNLEFDQDNIDSKQTDLYQVLTIIACSSIGSSCCVKHFIPYKNINEMQNIDNLLDTSEFFINYLYLYFVLFDSISLYKPNSSKSNNGEFYVIGKGFKGITDDQLENLFNIIDNFTVHNSIIDSNKIPLTFIYQLTNFLEYMSNINTVAIEKQILLLTCYKNLYENDGKDNKDSKDLEKYKQTNKILKCNSFFNKKNIDNMLIPKYREWIKIFNFE